jgi:hypothetical protein
MMLAVADKCSAGNASSSRVCSTGEPSMLSNLSQFSPQGVLPQFPGLQTAGLPQMTPGLFGQPGFGQPGAFNPYNSTAQFGHDSGQAGLSHPSAFGGQPNPFVQNPFIQNQFAPSPFAPNSYQANPYQHQQGPWSQSPGAYNPLQSSFGGHPGATIPVHQIVPVLGQLAQQIAVQSALAQQIGIAVQQLAQQLAAQGQQGYSGFNPQQAQAWGANRSQTIQ